MQFGWLSLPGSRIALQIHFFLIEGPFYAAWARREKGAKLREKSVLREPGFPKRNPQITQPTQIQLNTTETVDYGLTSRNRQAPGYENGQRRSALSSQRLG